MSESDYKTGLQGGTFVPGMNYGDWYAGRAVFDTQQGPKTEIDGVGFTGLAMAHVLAIMYPVAGAITITSGSAAFLLVRFWDPEQFGWALTGAVVAGLVAMHFGVKAEHSLSRSRTYRVVRHVLRMAIFGGAGVLYLFPELRGAPPAEVEPGAFGAFLLIIVVMHFLFRAFDRRLFPVRDRKAITQEQKYGDLTDEETSAIKNAKFRGICWFTLTWLLVVAALAFAFRETVPAVLLVAGPFVVLWLMRKRWFFKLHRQRLADGEVLRTQRRAAAETAAAEGAGAYTEGRPAG